MSAPLQLLIPTLILALAAAALAWRWFSINQLQHRRSEDHDAWNLAIEQQESQVTQLLLSVSRPVATLPALKDLTGRDEYENLQKKLLAGGNTFAGSLEVYLAVQTVSLLLGTSLALTAALGGFGTGITLALLLGAIGISMYPWDYVSRQARDRGKAVDGSLPEFAQFLNMSLAAGRNPYQALEFTAARVEGPISDEVKDMLTVLRSKEMNTEEAFMLAAYRLGTPLSYQFMISLMKATQEGKKLTETLSAQAEAVRNAVYQRRRSDAKKLPSTLVIFFFIHMLPLLFIVVLLPAVHAFSQL